ncbi:uncharacterized protein LOC115633782 [Scaptodrosophila lebanonensis]|uniref:Uncharacterized protein LOC115633782 n=1 Tax=Drosophila lebanonensis TaxID=7225 RepID=A0A6J2UFC4_DROLE|nr:uncharacterized protein LOC115633782 [Scaptodrosophila lebanonensis]
MEEEQMQPTEEDDEVAEGSDGTEFIREVEFNETIVQEETVETRGDPPLQQNDTVGISTDASTDDATSQTTTESRADVEGSSGFNTSTELVNTSDHGLSEGTGEPERITVEYVEKINRQKRKEARQKKREDRQKYLESKERKSKPIVLTTKSLLMEEDYDEDQLLKERGKLLLRGTYDEQLMRELEEMSLLSTSSTISSTDSEICTVAAKTQFLTDFAELPEMKDISEEEIVLDTAQSIILKVEEERPTQNVDVGHFVDPLTGMQESSSSSESVEVQIVTEIVEEEQVQESSELELMPDEIEVPVATEETAEDFLDMMAKSFVEFTYVSTTDLESRRIARENARLANDLLQRIINEVVDRAERIDPKMFALKNLDKSKLMKNLIRELQLFICEKQINENLHSKIIDYCKRTKSFRLLSKNAEQKERVELDRFNSALNSLDHFKKCAAMAKKMNSYLMSSVLMDLAAVRSVAMSTEVDLENTIRKNLIRKDSEFLSRIVNRELRLMNNVRNEISDARYDLLIRKHTLGRLNERIAKFEYINDELEMSQFISKQTEVLSLSKKIEERSTELRKMRTNYTNELHALAHMREKSSMLASSLEHAKGVYDRAVNDERKLRETLFKLKVERGKTRHESQDIAYNGGLLSNPSLMYDYDHTVEKLKKKYEIVKKLKKQQKQLIERVNRAEMLSKQIIDKSST